MSDTKYSTPKAIYKPGELESVRKNLGDISPEEAKRVANLLGGEVGVEKVPEFAPIKNPVYDKTRRPASASKNAAIERKRSEDVDSKSAKTSKRKSAANAAFEEAEKKARNLLPPLTNKEKSQFDKLMASSDYKIKKPQNFFTILFSIGKVPDRVSPNFVSERLLNYLNRMDKFFSSIKQILDNAESDFRLKVQTYEVDKYKFFRFASEYNVNKLRSMQKDLSKNAESVTVADMVPFIKEIYRPLLKIFYLGEERIVNFIREAFKEITGDRKLMQAKLYPQVREASAEWIYIYNQVIKGLYPLLMRMCTNEILPFARFFNKNSAKILTFLELTKFELILPDADQQEKMQKEKERLKAEEEEKRKKAEAEKVAKQRENDDVSYVATADDEEVPDDADDELEDVDDGAERQRVPYPRAIVQSLKALEMIFPDAGWQNLGYGTDLFPYFHPIYKFADGFNLLSENNPMQVTIVLMRILEDFFQGCRNIKFIAEKGVEGSSGDNISSILFDWSAYRESVFERDYLPVMKEICNHVSTQSDFIKTPYARKQIASMLWEARTMFLPYLDYEFFFMEKEINNPPYKPLARRVRMIRDMWGEVLQQVEVEKRASQSLGREFTPELAGAENILKPYSFAVSNIVSKRLDALFPPKSRTNLTLLKFTYSVIVVLDWWISNDRSPAYSLDTTIPYRTNPEDGSFQFSATPRTDVQAVFMRTVKARQAAFAKQKADDANVSQS